MWLPQEGLRESDLGLQRCREVWGQGESQVDGEGWKGEAQPGRGAPGDHVLVTLDPRAPDQGLIDTHGRELTAGRTWGLSKGNCCRSCSLKVNTETVWDARCL